MDSVAVLNFFALAYVDEVMDDPLFLHNFCQNVACRFSPIHRSFQLVERFQYFIRSAGRLNPLNNQALTFPRLPLYYMPTQVILFLAWNTHD